MSVPWKFTYYDDIVDDSVRLMKAGGQIRFWPFKKKVVRVDEVVLLKAEVERLRKKIEGNVNNIGLAALYMVQWGLPGVEKDSMETRLSRIETTLVCKKCSGSRANPCKPCNSRGLVR